MPSGQPISSGLVERIGLENSVITHKMYKGGEEAVTNKTTTIADHRAGLEEVNRPH